MFFSWFFLFILITPKDHWLKIPSVLWLSLRMHVYACILIFKVTNVFLYFGLEMRGDNLASCRLWYHCCFVTSFGFCWIFLMNWNVKEILVIQIIWFHLRVVLVSSGWCSITSHVHLDVLLSFVLALLKHFPFFCCKWLYL